MLFPNSVRVKDLILKLTSFQYRNNEPVLDGLQRRFYSYFNKKDAQIKI